MGFIATSKAASVVLAEEQVKKIFMKYDTNHDNHLDKKELKQAFKELGASIPGLRARRGLRLADANGDGVVDSDELDALVKYACKRGYKVT